MRSSTLPPERSFHFCPISFSSRCQGEPDGASVPSLTTTSAAAAGRAAASTQATAAAGSALRKSPCMIILGSLVGEQLRRAGEQPAGAPLGDDVGQAMRGVGVDVGGEHALEEPGELRLVLRLDARALRERNQRSELLVPRERERPLEVLAGPLDAAAVR